MEGKMKGYAGFPGWDRFCAEWEDACRKILGKKRYIEVRRERAEKLGQKKEEGQQ